jgi:phosphatidylserine/phosphatidylglycerophosphate/cardiolipin synthase-like enzyme
MRKKTSSNGLTVNAIAGTYVVTLGLDITKAKASGLLGFAIQRLDHTDGERIWLRSMKTFEATDPLLGPGGTVSSLEHPFQTFQWADYSVKPKNRYTYRVVALRGKPTALQQAQEASVTVMTEEEDVGPHSIYFNRGAVGTQEYARRFENKDPDEVGPPAFKWLSRGLVEALLEFIAEAKGPQFELHGAVYEFEQPEVLQAIAAAKKLLAKVKIVYDAAGAKKDNLASIKKAKILGICVARTKAKIAHNKFFVLSKNGKPIKVWTGSTNLTRNGIYGHSNLGHVVRDPVIAAAYKEYWKQLSGDPIIGTLKTWTATHPAPPNPWNTDITAVFSPRGDLKALDWYRDIARTAQRGLFMTFAFGMHPHFLSVYDQNDGVLRFALMEKKGMKKAQADQIDRVRRLPNCIVAVGNRIITNSFDRWLAEKTKIDPKAHVLYIHTKYMLVDPLGDKPIVVTGSANFSKASTDTNDENMLVIRGDKRVADIYLGEFMRLYSHYAFREAVAIARANGETWSPKHLIPDSSWTKDYYKAGSDRELRRRYFADT